MATATRKFDLAVAADIIVASYFISSLIRFNASSFA